MATNSANNSLVNDSSSYITNSKSESATTLLDMNSGIVAACTGVGQIKPKKSTACRDSWHKDGTNVENLNDIETKNQQQL